MAEGFRFDLIPPGSGVVCALSGGADSMYLLCRLLEGRERYGWAVCAAHFNHGLRPTAQRDEDFVRGWCKKQGVPVSLCHENVAEYAFKNKLSVEEAGRVLRYRFLEDVAWERGDCEHPAFIATGHHAGDNAETVLMNLIRGCGLKGLTGIPQRRGNIVRPMLEVSRAEIEAYLTQHGIPHVEDETNGDLSYTRNRVRRRLLPLLEELNPRAAAHIAAAARRLGEDEALLSAQAARLLEEGVDIPEGVALPVRTLREVPRPLALRCCAGALDRAGLGGEAVHLEKILDLALGEDPSAQLDVPGGSVRRQYELLAFLSGPDPEALPPVMLEEGEQVWGEWSVACTPAVCPPKAYVSPWEFYLRPGRCLIRPRREGDALTLGERPAKSVKKLMIEKKIPARSRKRIPVLELEGRVAALGGFGPDRAHLAAAGGPALHIMMKDGGE